MGEHLPCKQGVKGSIPFVSTMPFFENRIGKKRGKAAKAALQRHREDKKGQDSKGVRWMPRCQESKKDAVNCEKLRGVVSRH